MKYELARVVTDGFYATDRALLLIEGYDELTVNVDIHGIDLMPLRCDFINSKSVVQSGVNSYILGYYRHIFDDAVVNCELLYLQIDFYKYLVIFGYVDVTELIYTRHLKGTCSTFRIYDLIRLRQNDVVMRDFEPRDNTIMFIIAAYFKNHEIFVWSLERVAPITEHSL